MCQGCCIAKNSAVEGSGQTLGCCLRARHGRQPEGESARWGAIHASHLAGEICPVTISPHPGSQQECCKDTTGKIQRHSHFSDVGLRAHSWNNSDRSDGILGMPRKLSAKLNALSLWPDPSLGYASISLPP